MDKEIFYLICDSDGVQDAAKVAHAYGVPIYRALKWVRERNGKQKTIHSSKVLRQKRQFALNRV